MEFKELLLKRESCRSYTGEPVSDEDLEKILEAGRLSPSGCNAQPWRFIVVNDPEMMKKLYDSFELPTGLNCAGWSKNAGAYIIMVETHAEILPQIYDWYKDYQVYAHGDIGRATLNMCYQSLELGLATCVIGVFNPPKLHELFGIPEDCTVRELIAIGHPKPKPVRQKIRKELSEIVSYNHW